MPAKAWRGIIVLFVEDVIFLAMCVGKRSMCLGLSRVSTIANFTDEFGKPLVVSVFAKRMISVRMIMTARDCGGYAARSPRGM